MREQFIYKKINKQGIFRTTDNLCSSNKISMEGELNFKEITNHMFIQRIKLYYTTMYPILIKLSIGFFLVKTFQHFEFKMQYKFTFSEKIKTCCIYIILRIEKN